MFRPLLFTLYISPLAKVISRFWVNHAQLADDAQLYIALKDDNSTPRPSECLAFVRLNSQHWLDINGLSMNPDKTEAIVIGTSTRNPMEGLVNTVDLGCVSQPSEQCSKSGSHDR